MKKFKGVTRFEDRHGVVRWRARAKGKTARMIPGPWGSEAFVKAYEEWRNGKPLIIAESAPGTIGALVAAYLEVLPQVEDLADNTKKAYSAALQRFRNDNGVLSVASLTTDGIKAKLDKMAVEPSNMMLRCLRRLCEFGVAEKVLKKNPCAGIKKRKPRQKSDGWHTWTVEEVERFERHEFASPELTAKARLAMNLLLCTASRKSDAVTLGRQHEVEGGAALRYRQKKTGKWLELPILSSLRAAIDAAPRKGLTYLETSFGRPFTANGFGNWFRERCDEAGLPQCSAHGLRKAAATRLADALKTAHEIQAVTGQSLSEVERYTRAANQKRLARGALTVVKPDSGFAKSKA